MDAGLLAVLNDAERLLVAETEAEAMAELDEDGVVALHTRVRRARGKYVGQYRRAAAVRVPEQGGRGLARAEEQPRAPEGRGLRGGTRPSQRATGAARGAGGRGTQGGTPGDGPGREGRRAGPGRHGRATVARPVRDHRTRRRPRPAVAEQREAPRRHAGRRRPPPGQARLPLALQPPRADGHDGARRSVELSAFAANSTACSCARAASRFDPHCANTAAAAPSGSLSSAGQIVVPAPPARQPAGPTRPAAGDVGEFRLQLGPRTRPRGAARRRRQDPRPRQGFPWQHGPGGPTGAIERPRGPTLRRRPSRGAHHGVPGQDDHAGSRRDLGRGGRRRAGPGGGAHA